jgi:hypothetical protein
VKLALRWDIALNLAIRVYSQLETGYRPKFVPEESTGLKAFLLTSSQALDLHRETKQWGIKLHRY